MDPAGQLRAVVADIDDRAIFLLDPAGLVVTWNEGARRLTGYAPEEIVGQDFRRLYPAEEAASDRPSEQLAVAARDGRYRGEGWRVGKDGSPVRADVSLIALRDGDGAIAGFAEVTRSLGSGRDPIDLRSVIEAIRDYAIFLLGPDGRIRSWNRGARLIKGWEAEEIVGEHFSRFYTDEDIARDYPAHELAVAQREGRFEDEGWRVRKDGSRFWANVVITALHDESGSLIGFAKVTRDLTQRREAEEALRATAASLERSNEELERFAAAAAHDLVQPLHTIVGLADLIGARAGEGLDPVASEALDHVRAAGARLSERVDALLRYARSVRSSLVVRQVRVDDALDEVVATLQRPIAEAGGSVVRDGDLGVVSADPLLLEVVLQNLIANALKFTAGAPRIVVSASVVSGGFARISVSDDGVGIPSSQQERIFGLFTRAHDDAEFEGVGMGLPLCRQIVERHGGRMGVSSVEGSGATFWFTLPTG